MDCSVLILAGGSGTRFWPASRRRRPKQLLALDGERSLLQQTVDRLAPLVDASRVWVSTTAELAPAIAEQLPELTADRILVEPVGRNTAPAILGAVARLPAAARAQPNRGAARGSPHRRRGGVPRRAGDRLRGRSPRRAHRPSGGGPTGGASGAPCSSRSP